MKTCLHKNVYTTCTSYLTPVQCLHQPWMPAAERHYISSKGSHFLSFLHTPFSKLIHGHLALCFLTQESNATGFTGQEPGSRSPNRPGSATWANPSTKETDHSEMQGLCMWATAAISALVHKKRVDSTWWNGALQKRMPFSIPKKIIR